MVTQGDCLHSFHKLQRVIRRVRVDCCLLQLMQSCKKKRKKENGEICQKSRAIQFAVRLHFCCSKLIQKIKHHNFSMHLYGASVRSLLGSKFFLQKMSGQPRALLGGFDFRPTPCKVPFQSLKLNEKLF